MQKRSFYIEEAFNKTTEEVLEFFAAKLETIVSTVPIRDHCAATLQGLWDSGHTIHLITARDEQHRQITKDWLRKHEVPYHTLYMSPRDESYCKGELCAKLGVDFFVDDKKENAEDVARHGIYTLLYHASHNVDHKTSLPVVKTWLEVQQHIDRLLRENFRQVP